MFGMYHHTDLVIEPFFYLSIFYYVFLMRQKYGIRVAIMTVGTEIAKVNLEFLEGGIIPAG